MDKGYYLDREEMKHHIQGFLERYSLPLEEIKKVTKPWPGCDKGLITVGSEGVQANLDAFWWTRYNPFYALSTLAFFEIPLLNKSQIVQWIKQQQQPDGYFRTGKLGYSVRGSTYRACVMLHLLGAERDETGWNRAKLIELVQNQQRPGQRRHFDFLPKDNKGFYAELELAFCCVGSLKSLGETLLDPRAAIQYLQGKQAENGSFDLGRVKKTPYLLENAAFDLVRSLRLLDADLRHLEPGVSVLQNWQLPDGGFDATMSQYPQYPPVSNFGQTYNTLFALYLLSAQPRDKAPLKQRAVQLWLESSGYPWTGLTSPAEKIAAISLPETLLSIHRGLLGMAALEVIQPIPLNLSTLILYS